MKVTVTDEMLDAAMKKAVEAGLLPRCARHEDAFDYQELIRHVIHAALEARPAAQKRCGCQQRTRHNDADTADLLTTAVVKLVDNPCKRVPGR